MTANVDQIVKDSLTPEEKVRITLTLSEASAKLLYLTLRCLSDPQKYPNNSFLRGGAQAMAADLEDFIFLSSESSQELD